MARDTRRYRDDDEDDRPRRRSRDEYDDRNDYADGPGGNPRRGPARAGVNVVGIISLIMGVVGLLLSLLPCVGVVGLPIAAIGLVLGVIGLFTGKTTGRGLPIAGTVVSLGGLLIGGGWLFFFVYAKNKGEERMEVLKKEMEQAAKEADAQAKLAEERRKKEEQELREGKATTVTAAQLYKEYDTNPLNADRKYKDKVVEVTGEFRKLDRSFGKLVVVLNTDNADGSVRCEFPRTFEAQLAKLTEDQKITVRGKCTGVEAKKDAIRLDNCLLVSK